jgi:hypothetical protein
MNLPSYLPAGHNNGIRYRGCYLSYQPSASDSRTWIWCPGGGTWIGWIEAINQSGARVDVFGALVPLRPAEQRPGAAVIV